MFRSKRLTASQVAPLIKGSLEPGTRIRCPQCNGGRSGERSFVIFESEKGGLMGTCHRSSCSLGTVSLDKTHKMQTEVTANIHAPARDDYTLRGIYGAMYNNNVAFMHKLGARKLDMYTVLKRAGLPQQYTPDYSVWVTRHNQAILPLHNSGGDIHGMVLRALRPSPNTRKSLAYYESSGDERGLGFFGQPVPDASMTSPLYVVEDWFSAAALCYIGGRRSLSLNGTLLNYGRVRAIRRVTSSICLCLDADATTQALKAANKWRSVLDIRVRRLTKDIKNMDSEEIMTFLKEE